MLIRLFLRALLTSAFLTIASPALAQGQAQAASAPPPVTLESLDGSIRLQGDVVAFDGLTYALDTGFGVMEVAAAGVRCIGLACPDSSVVRMQISGAASLGRELLPALIDAFSIAADADMSLGARGADGSQAITLRRYDGRDLAVITRAMTGSTPALNALAEGQSALALTTRVAKPQERADSGRATEEVLALDGLLVVTAPGNPVRALSMQRIAQIFAGKVTNWAELGGRDAPITLYGRGPESGTGTVFADLVMRPDRLSMADTLTVLPSDAAVADAVRQDRSAIGFTSYSNTRGAQALAIRGSCGIQTPATAFTIKTEEYPLTRRIFAYRAPEAPALAAEFLNFALSDLAQPVIARAGFVDQGVSALSVNDMGLRFVAAVLPSEVEADLPALQAMMAELVAADRLSLTFRFEAGSSRLDTRARADMQRLAALVQEGRFVNRELLFLGFTDAKGPAKGNATLSRTRAAQAVAALRAQLPEEVNTATRITAIGYGELSPLGCNDTRNGRRINRRVEVWMREIVD